MKAYIIIFVFFLHVLKAQDPGLIAFLENDKWGYINKNGDKIIQAQFQEAGNFEDNLAPVRLGGYYGYIGPDGKQKIKAQYDYATPFDNGFAMVAVKGKHKIINTNGETIFEPGTKDILVKQLHKLLIVKKDSTKSGLYNLSEKRWSLEPIYGNIHEFAENCFLVSEYELKKEKDYSLNKSAIWKTSGNFITEFDLISDLQPTDAGGFIMDVKKDTNIVTKILDKDGHLITSFKDAEEKYYYGKTFSDGLIMKFHYGNKKEHVSYQDKNDKAVINNTKFKDGEPFLNGRTIVKDKNDKWGVIDLKGNYVSNERFEHYGVGFETVGMKTDVCIVRNEHFDYGIIANTGKYLIKPKFNSIEILDYDKALFLAKMDDTTRRIKIDPNNTNEILDKIRGEHNGKEDSLSSNLAKVNVVEKEKSLEELFEGEDYRELCGIIGLKGEIIIPFKYRDLGLTKDEDILYFRENNIEGFMKMSGEVIWQHSLQADKKNKMDTMDVAYMERGYCFAAANGIYRQGLGGWGGSENKAQRNTNIKADYTKGKLSLWIDTLSVDTFYTKYLGRKMYLCNDTRDTVILDAQDSRLYITMQALDSDGIWKDIEYSPSSWCGNSYHEVGLLPNQYWKFTIPVYKGAIPVKLRMSLIGERNWDNDNKRYKTGKIIYSNEFTGRINPGQFWRKKGHNATGIMDSYND